MKRRNVVYVRALLVILAIVVLLAFANRSPQRAARDTWLPSTFNPVGAGSMAFYQTLLDLHWPVERWREPLGRLAATGNDNVLVITRSAWGANANFSEQEIDLLDDWVKTGNTLVLLGALSDWDDTRGMLYQFGFDPGDKLNTVGRIFAPLVGQAGPDIEATSTSQAPRPGRLILPQSRALPVLAPPTSHTLWLHENDPYVVEIPRGSGHIVLGASDHLFSNGYLVRGDNLPIALQLLTPGGKIPRHIFFEESHHGFSAIFAVAHLLDHPGLRFAGLLALLGSLAFFGSSFVRFGPVVPLEPENGRSAIEFVDSIADLYLRADLRNDTIAHLFAETHQRILQRLNLPPTASNDLISSRLEQAHPHLPKWKKLAQRFDSPDYIQGLPPSGWMRVARELIEIKSAMA